MNKKIKKKWFLGNFHAMGYGELDKDGKIVNTKSSLAHVRVITRKGKKVKVYFSEGTS